MASTSQKRSKTGARMRRVFFSCLILRGAIRISSENPWFEAELLPELYMHVRYELSKTKGEIW